MESQFHINLSWINACLAYCLKLLNVKALIGAFNQEKALSKGLPRDFITLRRFISGSTAHLVYDQPLVLPADNEEGVERDTELLVGDLGDVLDVDTHVHHRLRLVGQIELGVVLQ